MGKGVNPGRRGHRWREIKCEHWIIDGQFWGDLDIGDRNFACRSILLACDTIGRCHL